jgi:hypothetical protein
MQFARQHGSDYTTQRDLVIALFVFSLFTLIGPGIYIVLLLYDDSEEAIEDRNVLLAARRAL